MTLRTLGLSSSRSRRVRYLMAAAGVLAAALPLVNVLGQLRTGPGGAGPERGSSAGPARALAQLPLSFEANVGQASRDVSFLARGHGYDAYLTHSGAALEMSGPDGQLGRLGVDFVGANPSPAVSGLDQQAGRANYIVGSDPANWRTNVGMFSRIVYREVYPGIDVVYHGTRQALEYDFMLAPGADPRLIALDFPGAERLTVDSGGDLLVSAATNTLRHRRPVAFQDMADGRHSVDASYVVGPDGTVRLRLGHYEPARPLVVDPVIEASSFYGGSGVEYNRGMAVDRSGNVYLGGRSFSDDFPTTRNALFPSMGAAGDAAVVVKLNRELSAVQYATYLMDGGERSRASMGGLDVDADGNLYVVGRYIPGVEPEREFPTTRNRIESCAEGGGFLTKLSPEGGLLYSTCLTPPVQAHNSHNDEVTAVAAGAPNRVWVTGYTQASNFPTTPGTQAYGGGNEGFMAEVDTTRTGRDALVFSTYIGGKGHEFLVDIALDDAGNVYATGETESKTSFLVDCQDPTSPEEEGVLVKLDASGALQYATCGPMGGVGASLAVDSVGHVYIVGQARGDVGSFITSTAYRREPSELYMAKLSPTGSVLYASYLPGAWQDDIAMGRLNIAVDDDGHAYIVGYASEGTFVAKNTPLQTSVAGGFDAFVAEIDTNKAGEASLVFSTSLGGSGKDGAGHVAIGPDGDLYVFGGTRSDDMFAPSGPTGFSKEPTGRGPEWFVVKVSPPPRISAVSSTGGLACGGATLRVAGARLRDTSKVTFGDRDATEVQQIDETQVELVVPPHPPGPVEVTLVARSGTASFPYTFQPVPAPAVSGLSPERGPVEGGTSVTISGNELDCVRGVRFGDAEEAAVEPAAGGGVRAVAPAHSRGPVDVVLSADTGDGGRITSTPGPRFTYVAIPVVNAILPDCGPTTGGTQLAVQGRHLAGATGVSFGGATVPAIGDPNPDRLATISPQLPPGEVDLTVTTPDGTSAPVSAARFTTPCPAQPAEGDSDPDANTGGGAENSGGGQNLATPAGPGTPGGNTNLGVQGGGTGPGPGSGNAGPSAGVTTSGGGGGGTTAGATTPGSGGGGSSPAGAATFGGGGGGASPGTATTPGAGGGAGPAGAVAPGGGASSPAGATTPGVGGGGGSAAGAGAPDGRDPKEAPRYAMVSGRNETTAVIAGVVLLALFGCVICSVVAHLRPRVRPAPAWARAGQ